jgi:hypothetical protein
MMEKESKGKTRIAVVEIDQIKSEIPKEMKVYCKIKEQLTNYWDSGLRSSSGIIYHIYFVPEICIWRYPLEISNTSTKLYI